MNRWTREQTIITLGLYCRIPFAKASSTNPEIIKVAKLIGRSPNSVKMKVGNFGSFDERLKASGIVGLSNVSKLDKNIWEEYSSNWDKLAYESERLMAELENRSLTTPEEEFSMLSGLERERVVRQRINQDFFRSTILSSYYSKCCITGLDLPELLVASHIVPWSVDKENRTNPHNGLCLNSLHDKAFDKGLITISTDFRIIISDIIKRSNNTVNKSYFLKYENQQIKLPEKFIPAKDFLDYHNKNIFVR